jgi:hypothetical protein
MTDENKKPNWVIKSQEHLNNIVPKIDAIKKEGQAEIKRGLEKEKEADKLQNEADYLNRILSQQHDAQYWNDEIVTISGSWMQNRIQSLDNELDDIVGYAKEAGNIGNDYHARFKFAVSSTDSTAGTAVYLGAEIEKRFLVIEPKYSPVLSDFEPERLSSRGTLFQELKQVLEEFGQEYVKMLQGSETALGFTNPDSLSQAAHSMRDCFQQLLEYLAQSKVVASQPWFKPTEGPQDGVSRRSRLRYMLYGSGENMDDKVIQKLDELADITKNTLDLCIARAHDHDTSLTKDEVRLAIDQGRNALLHVLKQYKSFRER